MATAKASATKTATKEAATEAPATKKRSDLVCKVGNLGGDPELSITPGGKSVVNFNIAVNRKINDNVVTEWYAITAWESLAENIVASLTKGMRAIVYGVPSIEEYDKKDGSGKGKQKKINAWNCGPDLSFATAAVSKIERTSGDYSNQDEDF